MSTTTVARRPQWHLTHPPPPTPKILNLPRRIRHRKHHPKRPATRKQPPSHPDMAKTTPNWYCNMSRKDKLERLFGDEREFSRSDCADVPVVLLNSSASSSFSSGGGTGRRNRVEEEDFSEGKWKFQAEILRAECNFLRLEREVALKKLQRNKAQMERVLKSSVQSLISGRKKVYDREDAGAVLEEEIEDLASNLVELQRSSGFKDNLELSKYSNFDKKTYLLQRRLGKIGSMSDEDYVKELQDLADSSLSMNMTLEIDKRICGLGPRSECEPAEVETLRREMEGLSKEMLLRMEEDFGSILSSTANSSVASSASTSKRIDYQETSLPNQQPYQDLASQDDIRCTGRCKAIVRRIVEQVRAETEQWSQMQAMLMQVREEMEELQSSRKFWEDRALDSDHNVQCLQSAVEDWKEKAQASENKANELEKDVSLLKGELENLTMKGKKHQKELEKEKRMVSCSPKENYHRGEETTTQMLKEEKTANPQPISLVKQLEKEKRMLRRIKDKRRSYAKGSKKENSSDAGKKPSGASNNVLQSNLKRTPFLDIGNLSPLLKQRCQG